MDSPDVDDVLQKREKAYQAEKEAIEGKLRSDDVPLGKKERISFRLKDIQNRLYPGVIRKMQSVS
ncbi:MAG: hypothetical protein FJZ05_01200 [Candidatus Nealsonbacteria bacterium]|nr:hypothetical protein [Candidatus Nealsonbacteria bacterium]